MIVFVRGQTFNWLYWTEESNSRSHRTVARTLNPSTFPAERLWVAPSLTDCFWQTADILLFFLLLFSFKGRVGEATTSYHFPCGQTLPSEPLSSSPTKGIHYCFSPAKASLPFLLFSCLVSGQSLLFLSASSGWDQCCGCLPRVEVTSAWLSGATAVTAAAARPAPGAPLQHVWADRRGLADRRCGADTHVGTHRNTGRVLMLPHDEKQRRQIIDGEWGGKRRAGEVDWDLSAWTLSGCLCGGVGLGEVSLITVLWSDVTAC